MGNESESRPLVSEPSDQTLESSTDGTELPVDIGTADAVEEEVVPLTPAEMDRHECRACGYTYEPVKGDNQTNVPAGTAFEDLPNRWRCPVCGASQSQFSNVGPLGNPSGFKENLGYGFGVNALTPGQKNILIFGSLGLAVIFFLSLYGLR